MQWIKIVLIGLALTGRAMAQEAAPAKEGPLTAYINLDSGDAATKLEVVEQELFIAEQQNIRLEFMLRYGADIRMDYLHYASGDELIPGYVFTARSLDRSHRHPAVVLVHGGFHEHFDETWFPLVTALVEHGYAVIFPEYRGSRGYGENHYRNDYGVTDTADVLAAAQYFAGQPFVDPDRLAIIGESRGGMTALLAIEKEPNRFKAAIDIVGLTDFVAYMAYKPEYRRKEVAKEGASLNGKLPNENLAAYMAISPINGVDKIETPLLILATTGDKIAPLTLHTGRLLDALKARGKTFEAKIYDNAPGGHVFMHGDGPERADAYGRIFAWLQTYLGR